MAYSPAVEKWRPLVEKYFPPELVDKALYVIQGESGGNAAIKGDNGVAIGLFQIHDGTSISGRPSAQQLSDPEFNIKYAAQQLGAANGSWSAWGEGTTYQGKKFGALGNNPYPGDGPVNGRAPVGGGVEASGGDSGSGGYEPTGDFDSDIRGYWDAAEAAYRELSKYQNSSKFPVILGEGGVFFYDPDNENADSDGLVLDPVGTKIFQRAQINEAALDRLYSAREAGVTQSGSDSAQAYLASEKDKAAEATRKYEDGFIKRINNLVALEDIPKQRSMSMATALSTANAARSRGTFNQQGTGKGLSGRPEETDFSGYAKSLKSTIPAEAPAFRDIAPGAMEPYKPKARTPDAVLAGSGISAAPTGGVPTQTLPSVFNTQAQSVRNSGQTASQYNALNGPTQAPWTPPLPKVTSLGGVPLYDENDPIAKIVNGLRGIR